MRPVLNCAVPIRPVWTVPVLATVLASCAMVPTERAEAMCVEEARAARGPTGEIAMGGSTDGPYLKTDITISTDWLAGKDPSAIYSSCVLRKSGKPPVTPLNSRPEWTP